MDHARMKELDEQFNDSYCPNCKRECESLTVCESCGEPPKGEDIDMQYCRYCNEHATFIESCEFCGGEVTKGGRVEAEVMPNKVIGGGHLTDKEFKTLSVRITPAFYDIDLDGATNCKGDILRKLRIIFNDIIDSRCEA